MKRMIPALLILSLTVIIISPSVRAQVATKNQALTVATNWIRMIIEKKGDWGGSKSAEIAEIQELKRGDRILGFFCRVEPQGYIIVSLRKEMAPIKAYSAKCDLDPEAEEGMTDLIKDRMDAFLTWIEQRFGPISSVRTHELNNVLESNYQAAWADLERNVAFFAMELESTAITMDYQQGQELLTSSWHQGDPYNQQCPAPPTGSTCTSPLCAVGCGPLAASQIMRYWGWPPYGVGSPYSNYYDWRNMPDFLAGTSPAAQINAVAELCHEVGLAADEVYCEGGGCASGNVLLDNMGALTNTFRYSTLASREERRLYSSTAAWFNAIKAELNQNRPILYEIPQHFIVIDGWQEIGSPVVQQVHVVYGHGGSNDGFYTLDYNIPGSDPNWQWEKMIINTVPAQALSDTLSGVYSRDASFPFRYFDQDATGESATFSSGQNLQFLHNITVTCSSTSGGSIRFNGSGTLYTRLFTRGDPSRGAEIKNGVIKLGRNGSIKFY
jgi:hypothetical protein